MIPFSAALLRLLLALLLGAIIGTEREMRVHEAGMRTMALVSLGACLFEVISITGFSEFINVPHISFDPSRVASYVVAGIGFLGAGAIFRSQDQTRIKGLTTAATIWIVAAIGLACGTGLYLEAISATVLAVGVLVGLRYLELLFSPRKAVRENTFLVEANLQEGQCLAGIYEICKRLNITVDALEARSEQSFDVVKIAFKGGTAASLAQAYAEIRALPGVKSVQADMRKVEVQVGGNA